MILIEDCLNGLACGICMDLHSIGVPVSSETDGMAHRVEAGLPGSAQGFCQGSCSHTEPDNLRRIQHSAGSRRGGHGAGPGWRPAGGRDGPSIPATAGESNPSYMAARIMQSREMV